ncbi:MAG TPA: pyruvate ferredoxin oxidoreductase, partial [Armatimonadetes bacterium]|nr:pyruvate ferredoxin oxidoreductase [Armatimonadota bacterium]
AHPDSAAAFPITPQTEMMHKFAEFVADGDVDTELVLVESEHSAMSATVGMSAAGARAFTATSANGLALMWEIVYIAASTRLPIVMAVVNRALSAPINIHGDHSDSMGARDAGWIQLYSENSQEVYDNIIQAFKIAEDKRVLLPVMVTLDAFILSHTTEIVEVLDEKEAIDFIGEERIPHFSLLDVDKPVTVGPLDLQDYYMEHKRQQIEAIANAPEVIKEVGKAYGELTGRYYDFFHPYKCDGADVVILAAGSTAGTARIAVDRLREQGKSVGLVKLRMFRPFPYKELSDFLCKFKVVGIMDRSASFGAQGGPVFTETRSALLGTQQPPIVVDYLYGL